MSNNILFLTFYYQPDLSAGSFRNTLIADIFQEKLSTSGKAEKLIVITSMPNRYGSYSANAERLEMTENLIIHRIDVGTHKSGFLDQMFMYLKYVIGVFIIQRKYSYSTIYASSSRLMTAFLGALLKFVYRKPLYLDMRDIFRESISNVLTNRYLKFVINWVVGRIENFTFKRADIINVVTPDMEEYFKKFNSRVSCHTNGIDEVFFDYDFRKETKLDNCKIITFAGNVGKAQALEKVLPPFAKEYEDEVKILVVGDGSGKKLLIEEINKHKVKNIVLLDPVPRQKVLEYYKDSDYLFLNLDDKEAFYRAMPTKLFEYSATGKTIIAGLKGFAKNFMESNINNVLSFESNNYGELIKKFKNYPPVLSNREIFIQKFRRKVILTNMVKDIYKLHIGKQG